MEKLDLIDRAARGDRDAFSQLTKLFLPTVYDRILGTGAEPDKAFDLTLETFLRAWHGVSLFQRDEPFARWLERLAEDVAGAPEEGWGPGKGTEVPEQLHGAILRRIESESGRAVLKETLRRFRFTLIALLLVLIILLVSRLGGKNGKTAEAASPHPAGPAEETQIPEAALQPGT